MTAHMLNALYAITHPFVRLSITRVDQSKTVKDYAIFTTWKPHPPSFCGICFIMKF